MVVSVVTRGESDDCNSVEVDRDWVYLRLARPVASSCTTPSTGPTGTSSGCSRWRHGAPTKTGFLAQSPMGEGVSVRFSEVSYEQRVIADIRSGQ